MVKDLADYLKGVAGPVFADLKGRASAAAKPIAPYASQAEQALGPACKAVEKEALKAGATVSRLSAAALPYASQAELALGPAFEAINKEAVKARATVSRLSLAALPYASQAELALGPACKAMRTEAMQARATVSRLRQEHPKASTVAGIGLITLGGLVVVPAVTVGTLNLLGFGPTGVVGGSAAAGIQSTYGGYIASGSAFALAQSATMGGITVASVPMQAVSVGAMGLGAWLIFPRPEDK